MNRIKDLTVDPEQLWEKIKSNENIICFGAGSKGKQSLSILSHLGIHPKVFCDNDIDLVGKEVEGLPIINYKMLRESFSDYCILITTTIEYARSINSMLKEHNEEHPIYFFSNPFKTEIKVLDKSDLDENIDKYSDTYEMLEDNTSKKLFIEFLNWKMTGDLSQIFEYTEQSFLRYFDPSLIPLTKEQIYIDIGAYTGDSIVRFLAFSQGKYKKIYAFEPDNNNYEAILKLLEYGQISNVEVKKKALWSSSCRKTFYSLSNPEINYESCNIFEDLSLIAGNPIKRKIADLNEACNVEEIVTDTLDHSLGSMKPTLIKIDAMASEYPILCGAQNVIKNCSPSLVMEFGTHSNYIADTIPFLYSLNPKYKFYLRQKAICQNSRTYLYAINQG